MNNEIMTFTHEQFGKLDVMPEGDKFLFPAIDCAEKLGYTNSRDAVARHCPHVVKRYRVESPGKTYLPGDLL